mgnify:CR=1 FL=1
MAKKYLFLETTTARAGADDGPAGGSGKLLDIKIATSTTQQLVTTETWTDVTDLSITHTPASASNKIRLRAVVQCGTNAQLSVVMIRLMRGSTPIGVGVVSGSRNASSAVGMSRGNDDMLSLVSEFIDEPATTSATTYSVQFAPFAGGTTIRGTVNRSVNNTDADYGTGTLSSLTLEELAP